MPPCIAAWPSGDVGSSSIFSSFWVEEDVCWTRGNVEEWEDMVERGGECVSMTSTCTSWLVNFLARPDICGWESNATSIVTGERQTKEGVSTIVP
jgi:hypothetical protein